MCIRDSLRATHERLLKAYNSLVVLINTETMFRYLDETLVLDKECPRTNNPIEGGVNAQLRRLLRYHRGMSVEKRIKAVFWWCYLHSPRPLSAKEILKVMPTDASISKIYSSMNERAQLQGIIPVSYTHLKCGAANICGTNDFLNGDFVIRLFR